MRATGTLTCRLCGQEHRPARLAPGEKALCSRCGGVLAKGGRFGPDAPLVFSLTGLILAAPAAFLPFITAGKLGDLRVSLLFTGVGSLWDNGMRLMAVLIALCGGLLPIALLASIAALHSPRLLRLEPRTLALLSRGAHGLQHWAIPEVQVLAVLVALMKLGSLVNVTIGAGFLCYCASAMCLLLAQNSFDFEPTIRTPAFAETDLPVPS